MKKEDLLLYNTDIEEATFLYYRYSFILLIGRYINGILCFEEFDSQYSSLFTNVQQQVILNKQLFPGMKKFELSDDYRFTTCVCSIFRGLEEVDDEVTTEYELEIYIKRIHLEILKSGVL